MSLLCRIFGHKWGELFQGSTHVCFSVKQNGKQWNSEKIVSELPTINCLRCGHREVELKQLILAPAVKSDFSFAQIYMELAE